ncbi:NADH:flavin oxidoreductase/NADH oxidase [Corynebacterium sp. Q4381]|uniref:NADH:flavin oxidoreductase/NADH oxidase n=1 Tax=Corynebacterium sp. Marseille-Q4381 TaxID=3121597 RepID=UPI002FE62787
MSLNEPLTIRSATARNRIWLPPMCQYRCREEDGMPNDWHMMHYGARAAGGFGLIVAEATAVVPEGRISNYCAGLWSDEHAAAWAPIVAFAKSQGATFGIQLNHAGRKGSSFAMLPQLAGRRTIPVEEGGWQTVGPSPVPAGGHNPPRELTTEEVRALPGHFAEAAKRAVNIGVDFVEIHSAHGYLLHQFLSPFSNERTDEYGGSCENRARLLLEVVDAVRSAIPDTMPLFVRLSVSEWLDPEGWTLEDSQWLAPQLKDHGVDLIDVSTGGNTKAKVPVAPGYQVDHAKAVKEAAGLPTAAVGLITTPEQADEVVASGAADAVMIGRAALRDSEWALNALSEGGVPAEELPYPDSYFRGWA